MEEWYYAINGVQQGPVLREVLMQLLASGQVAGDSLVWREGMADWLQANRVAELVSNPARPTPTVSPQFQGSPQLLNYGVGDSIYQTGAGPLPYAGFWIRFAASVVDGIVLFAAWIVVVVILVAVASIAGGSGSASDDLATSLSNFLFFFVGWLYFALMTSSSKQASLGMMAVGIRVTDLYGRRISFGRATGRHFAAFLSSCFCCFGFLMIAFTIAFTEKKQAFHDQLAGTLVLRN